MVGVAEQCILNLTNISVLYSRLNNISGSTYDHFIVASIFQRVDYSIVECSLNYFNCR